MDRIQITYDVDRLCHDKVVRGLSNDSEFLTEFTIEEGDEKFSSNCAVYSHKRSKAKLNLYGRSLQVTAPLEDCVERGIETCINGVLKRFTYFINKHSPRPVTLAERVRSSHANINLPKVVTAIFNPADDANFAFHNVQKVELWVPYNQPISILSTDGRTLVITGVGFDLPPDAKEHVKVFVLESDPARSVTSTLYDSPVSPGEKWRDENHCSGFVSIGPNRQIVVSVSAQVVSGSLHAGFAFRTIENQEI